MVEVIVKSDGYGEMRAKDLWRRVLEETPLQVRRRASPYLRNVRKVSEREWLVQGGEGLGYVIRIDEEEGEVTCSCPFFKSLESSKGYCKHICAVAAYEIVEKEVLPRLNELKERL